MATHMVDDLKVGSKVSFSQGRNRFTGMVIKVYPADTRVKVSVDQDLRKRSLMISATQLKKIR